MLDPSDKLPPTSLDWVLVANSSRARCFVRDADNQALRELADFVHPESRQKRLQRGEQHGGKVFKGAASTQFAPATQRLLRVSVPLDLTLEQGAELEHRVTRALLA